MKKILITISLLFLIVNLSNAKIVEVHELQRKDGILYEGQEKFTGTAVEYHPNGQLEMEKEYKKWKT